MVSERQRAALTRLLGGQSLRDFERTYPQGTARRGLPSRQRLSAVLKQNSVLSLPEATALAAHLRVLGGRAEHDLANLYPPDPIEPLPASTPARRHRQLLRLTTQLPGSRWWEQPDRLIESMAATKYLQDPEWERQFRELSARYPVDQQRLRTETERILTTGRASVADSVDDGDTVVVRTAPADLALRCDRGALFVFDVTLRNTGTCAWTDRMLLRLGPPVTSNLPFTPGLLPVPDSAPGRECRILVPGRAQWFAGLAIVSYVMVTADCSLAVPGHLECRVDTRTVDRYAAPLPADYRPVNPR